MPGAGSLRHRVELQEKTDAASGSFAVTESFATFAEVWAGIETVDALEVVDGVQTSDGPTHRFTIRHRSDVTIEKWLLFEKRRFAIRGVEDSGERHRFLELLAEDIGAAA